MPRRQTAAPGPSDAERVERAASVLSPLEREMLILSAGYGLRNHEIAARLGISERRAEQLLARALRKFARAVQRRRKPWWGLW